MRVPRRQAGNALLVVAVLLAAVAASLRFFTVSSGQPAGAGTAGLTPAARPGGGADRTSNQAGADSPGSARVSPRPAVPPAVTLTGPAALPGAHVHPGYATPEDVVYAFYHALLSGSPAQACAYVTQPCPSFGSGPITGRVTVINAVARAADALVEITGTICIGTSCVPLTDRVSMPAGPGSFSAAWTSLTSGVYGWAGSPLPCVLDPATRQWHVRLS